MCISLVDNEAMQIKVRIACKEPRNISLTIFDAKNIMGIISVLFGPNNITSGNAQTQKYLTFLPVFACAEYLSWECSKKHRFQIFKSM